MNKRLLIIALVVLSTTSAFGYMRFGFGLGYGVPGWGWGLGYPFASVYPYFYYPPRTKVVVVQQPVPAQPVRSKKSKQLQREIDSLRRQVAALEDQMYDLRAQIQSAQNTERT